MRDAIGGVFSITAIVVFLIVVNCFLAFSVNYSRAFRAKNEIRSIIEKNEGLKCDALKQVSEFLSKYHYHISSDSKTWCSNNGYEVAEYNNTPLFCYKVQKVDITGATNGNATYKGAYYTVVTFVNIDIPIFNRIYGGFSNYFMVKGETALIYSSGGAHDALPKGC